MRIIAGDFKGRRLNSPLDDRIRPTSDKVKEAIFSMVNFDLPGAVVVDLFAGTGNLGLEALSRGAKHCYFGDNSRDSLKLIKENIKYCKAEDMSSVIAGDYLSVLERIHDDADLIFLDPPYKDGLMLSCLDKIAELDMLKEDGKIIAEHSLDEKLPDEYAGFVKIKDKNYSKIAVSIYAKPDTL